MATVIMREDVIESAVTFLQDPTVASSPLESRTAFLYSKNLTQAEVDTALARAGADSACAEYVQPVSAAGHQHPHWKKPHYHAPQRDWRDWFILATIFGGVGYGLYTTVKRYVYPIIAPPTVPQLEQDKLAVDESFERAFALLDQLAKDTESLKASEQSRAERVDIALADVGSVVNELKAVSRRREDDLIRINDEVRGLKKLIPKAVEGQRETADTRLKELNIEMKSLKTLLSQRMSSIQRATVDRDDTNLHHDTHEHSKEALSPSMLNENSPLLHERAKSPMTSTNSGHEISSVPAFHARNPCSFNAGARVAIPAWQLPTTESSNAGNGDV